MGDQRREVVFVERALCIVPDRDGGDRSRRAGVPAHVDVHRAVGHEGHRDHPQRRGRLRTRRRARVHALQRTFAFRAITCSASQARDSSSRKRASAAVASTTRCAPLRKVKRAFDMTCERALSRTTQGEVLAQKQLVQAMIADSWIDIEQFRLLVLRTAWKIDRYKDYTEGARRHLGGEGRDAARLSRRVLARAADPRLARTLDRNAVRGRRARLVSHGPRRRPDRGAQGDGRDVRCSAAIREPTTMFPDYHLIKTARRRAREVRRRAGARSRGVLKRITRRRTSRSALCLSTPDSGSPWRSAGNRRTRDAPTAATGAATTARSGAIDRRSRPSSARSCPTA